jgi:hypothetical protein
MNWQIVAIEDLKNYKVMCMGAKNISDEITAIDETLYSVRTSKMSAAPAYGGGNTDDSILNGIVKRDRLELNGSINDKLVTKIAQGLAALSENEYLALEYFYINRPPNYMDVLAEKVKCERSEIYRLKDRALRKFTIAMYGITDL